jgi:hypothetical protein
VSEYVLQCPFCNTEQTVTEKGRQVTLSDLTIENVEGPRRLVVKFAVCPNPRCREFSLSASLHALESHGKRAYTGKQLASWDLVPPSRARSFPVAVPHQVLEDYREACLIVEQSPKASAALARRCLSSILRDFWRVQHGSLSDEFRQVKGTVDPLTWEAIESVRSVGLIGARMESEGAEILETDPGEAKLLIGLIETLIQDWYVGREARRRRLAEIRQIAGEEGSPVAENGV